MTQEFHPLDPFFSLPFQTPIFVDEEQILTKNIIEGIIAQLQTKLSLLKVTKGEIVLVALPPSPRLFISVIALQSLGALPFLLDPTLPKDEFLRWSEAFPIVGTIADDALLTLLPAERIQHTPCRFRLHWGQRQHQGWTPFSPLFEKTSPPTLLPLSLDDEALITLSSGLYEAPQALLFTYRNIESSLHALQAHLPTNHQMTALDLPVSITLWTMTLALLSTSHPLIFSQSIPSEKLLQILTQLRCQHLITTPRRLIESPHWTHELPQTFLQSFSLVARRFPYHLHRLPFKLYYYLDECSGIVAWKETASPNFTPLTQHVEYKTQLPTARRSPQPTEKILHIRGEALSTGSWDIEGHFTPLCSDEKDWWKSGEMGHITSEGKLTLEGHQSDILGDEKNPFSRRQVEILLEKHPQIRAAALFSKSSSLDLKLQIALKPSLSPRPLDFKTLLSFLSQELPHYMLPKSVEFRNELPRNTFGEIAYWRLK